METDSDKQSRFNVSTMTSITPIPRPHLDRAKSGPLIELMNNMPGWTEADFETFKVCLIFPLPKGQI
jgi:hypothetical protein